MNNKTFEKPIISVIEIGETDVIVTSITDAEVGDNDKDFKDLFPGNN